MYLDAALGINRPHRTVLVRRPDNMEQTKEVLPVDSAKPGVKFSKNG